jgi:trimethylamine--corrinoid protein Co-methyltransferase
MSLIGKREMHVETIRPQIRMFSDAQVDAIIEEAFRTLEQVGFLVENEEEAAALLRDAGVRFRGDRAYPEESRVREALATAPAEVRVYDREGALALDLRDDQVHFDPGSAAVHFLDPETGRRRRPLTRDQVHLAWVAESCRHIAAQSTAIISRDVSEEMGDRWRLYVALCHCRKPVVTGTFRKDAFAVMKAMLAAVRGGEQALREKPLAIFDCCPSPPLSWSDLTVQALVDAARSGIPAELVSMPLAGATAPVTLREMVVQHCAENLSGILIHQLAAPGAPIIYGGSPSAFDMRHGTTPMGAIETMMVDMAYAQVGKRLGLPVHAYMGLSDGKGVDYQTGLESGAGVILAALAGINMVSGPGQLDFENCASLEKLVLDNEACGMALRLVRGIDHGSAGRAVELLQELLAAGTLLGHRHTRRNFRKELHFPGKLIDRATYDAWEESGASTALDRARDQVRRIIAAGNPAPLPAETRRELDELIRAEARRLGMETIPEVP